MNEIRSWSDYNRVYFHPKSMVTTTGYLLNSEFMPFDVFSYGRNAFLETEKEKESYDENFRLFAEECDQLQVPLLVAWNYVRIGIMSYGRNSRTQPSPLISRQ